MVVDMACTCVSIDIFRAVLVGGDCVYKSYMRIYIIAHDKKRQTNKNGPSRLSSKGFRSHVSGFAGTCVCIRPHILSPRTWRGESRGMMLILRPPF